MSDKYFRPYEFAPGQSPIHLEIETEDGRHFDVVGWPDKALVVHAPSRVQRAKITRAVFTPPLPPA